MISYDMFKDMINLMNTVSVELDNFNRGMERILGSDTSSMYYVPLNIVENYIISTLQTELGESKEGAEWFIYDGLSQINRGGTEIEENGKTYTIKSLKDYYDYLISLNN